MTRPKPRRKVTVKNKGGRPKLSAAEKVRRGTLRPHRERTGLTPKKRAPIPVKARAYLAIADAYQRAVLSGEIVAGQLMHRVCERQRLDRARRDAAWPFVWSAQQAERACTFIEQCPHVEGSWSTTALHLEPWQVFLVVCLFGWRLKVNPARRRFTTLYLEVARKAAKSTLMAAIALYHLMCEGETGASVVCGATTGQQARIVFGIMQKMVRRSAFLRNEGAQVFANAIIFEDGAARPVNAKATTLDGLNPSCIVLDESHAQEFGLHDVLKSAQGARQNPLLLCPTTAGYDLLSVGYALRSQLVKVLERVYTADHLLGAIYTLDDGDDWRDEAVWPKANPMLGITPSIDYVRRYCRDAQQTAGVEGEFKVKICNLWLQSAASWLSMIAWDACADASLSLDQFVGEPCYIGGDLAQRDDLAAVALLFVRGELLIAFVQFYLPADVVEERARAVPAYAEWARAGLLKKTEGAMIDYNVIESDIRVWCKRFKVKAIRFDQYGSAQIASRLQTDGLPVALLDKNAKTFTPPAQDLETRVKHRRFRHDGNSCLKWMASNVVVTRRIDDTILPKKESAESPNKIDGIDAILEALSAQLLDPTTTRKRRPARIWTPSGFVPAVPTEAHATTV